MTPDETKLRFLDHLERMARAGQKEYAWWASKNYASMLREWADLPDLLKERMNAKSG